jgi:hypothetical protein
MGFEAFAVERSKGVRISADPQGNSLLLDLIGKSLKGAEVMRSNATGIAEQTSEIGSKEMRCPKMRFR